MANIGSLLKDEITRLSRRALRSELDGMKKALAQHRRHIAALKREVAELDRQSSGLERTVRRLPAAPPSDAGKRIRFVAKGLRSQRERLGLSAADFAKLAGVSAQSIYNWERETAKPRAEQVKVLAGLRGIGSREARARLERMQTREAGAARKS